MQFLFSPDPADMLYDKLKKALGENAKMLCREILPEKWTPNKGMRIVVSNDASQSGDLVQDRDLVRISVHSHDHRVSRRVAAGIDGFLTTPSIMMFGLHIDRSRSTKIMSGPDSLSGGFVATASYSCLKTRKVIDYGTSA